MNWYVLYTKPKWEKKVAERLNGIGLKAYCPTISKVSQWSDRKKTVQVPLFNSYVFVKVEDQHRSQVFQILGVVRFLFWLGKPAIVQDHEIEAISNWLSNPNEFEVSVEDLKKGDIVVLESGPFKSHSAVVQEVKNRHYVLVLECFGCILRVNKKSI